MAIAVPTVIINSNTASNSPQTLNTTATVPAGAAIFVVITNASDLHSTANLIQDQVGNTYNLVSFNFNAGQGLYTALYACYNAISLPSGDSITQNTGNFAGFICIAFYVTGLASSAALDVDAGWTAGTFGTSVSKASGTLGQVNELVLFLVGNIGTAPAAGGGATLLANQQDSPFSIGVAYDIVGPTTSVTPSMTWTGNTSASYDTLSFKGVGPAYIQNGSVVGNTSSGTSLSVPYPATTYAGDTALMLVSYQNVGGTSPSPTISPPAGWSTLSTHFSNFTFEAVFYQNTKLTGSEGGTSVTVSGFQQVGAGGVQMNIAEFTGVDPTTTFWEGLGTNGGASATVTGTSITTLGTNRLGVHCALGNAASATGVNVPSSWTGEFDILGSNCINHLDTIAVPTAQTVSAPSSTTKNSPVTMFWGTIDFALIPGAVVDNLLGAQWL